ncbi:MAG: hypothetical protein ACLTYB_07860 [Clostridium paraputrificum]
MKRMKVPKWWFYNRCFREFYHNISSLYSICFNSSNINLKSIARFKKFSKDYFVEYYRYLEVVTAYIAGLLIYKLI